MTIKASEKVTIEEFFRVVSQQSTVSVDSSAYERIDASRQFLEKEVANKRLIYGVTSGYGPLANTHISPEQSANLQQNLVYFLATGTGQPYSIPHTRAMMLARIVSLSQGHSAINRPALNLLSDFVNKGIHPVVPSIGTVGASGDLQPLAHIALAMMGKEKVIFEGKEKPASKAIQAIGNQPLSLKNKDGIALVNGTSAMTGVAAVNGALAQTAVDKALQLTAMYAEIMAAKSEPFHPLVSEVRPHRGQIKAAERLRDLVNDSTRLKHFQSGKESAGKETETVQTSDVYQAKEVIQDAYTIRCAPQLYGAVIDAIGHHNATVETELNSVSDNPIIFAEKELILNGGNFLGQHIAFVSDGLANAVIQMAVHLERIVSKITNPLYNDGLPAFLQGNKTGLHSGLMGAQMTATALLANMRSRSVPASIQSISTNADNQDVVSMGTIAALKTAELVDNLFDLLSICAITMTQAFELKGGFEANSGFGKSAQELATTVRNISPFIKDDRPLYGEIATVAQTLGKL